MLDKAAVMELLAIAEKNGARSEVAELLEGCLAEQSSLRLEYFIQHNVLTNDSPVNVLQDLAESVHQHMIALQESLFELRSTMLKSLNENCHVDLVSLPQPISLKITTTLSWMKHWLSLPPAIPT